MFNLRYPYSVEIDRDDEGNDVFFLSCPLVPEPIALGSTIEEAKEDLVGLILFTASEYRKDGRLFPITEQTAEPCVELNICQSLKIFLLNAMTETRTKPIDIANKLNLPRQRITPLLNPNTASRLEVVINAIEATGKSVNLIVS